MGTPTPPKIDKEKSEQIILLSIMNLLKNKADITKEIDVSFSNPLVKDVWGKEVPKEEGKEGETVVILGEEEKKKDEDNYKNNLSSKASRRATLFKEKH